MHANVRTTFTAALNKHATNLRELTRITEPSSGNTRPFRGDNNRFPNNNNRNDIAKPQSSTLLDLPQYKWSEPPTSAGPSEPKKKGNVLNECIVKRSNIIYVCMNRIQLLNVICCSSQSFQSV